MDSDGKKNFHNVVYTYKTVVSFNDCDAFGVVSNSQFLSFLSDSRYSFLKSIGVDYIEMIQKGLIAFVSNISIDYLLPLRPNDRIAVLIELEAVKRTRLLFHQTILNEADDSICSKATVSTLCLDSNDGFPQDLTEVYEDLYKKFNLISN